jgi:uncharacterized membrane protein YgcG
MNSNNPDPITESIVKNRLEELKNVPARNPLQAASERARFLREAAEYRQAVSPGRRVRQSGWTFQIRKEKLSMNALVSLILAASLLLGGGATVAAAQDDLPNQSLYQLKLWTENASLAMNGEPQEQATLLMNMAQTRVQELAALAEMGVTPPDQVRVRLEQHLRQMLQLAANMDDAACEKTLLQLREHLQVQERIMEQLQTHANPESEPLLTQTRLMLQNHLRLVNDGLADPQGFRYMIQNQIQYGQDEEAIAEPNQQGEPGFHQNSLEGQPAGEPGAGNENGNDTPGEPNPDRPQNGNDGKGSDDESNGGSNQDNSQGGNGSGSGNDGGGGSGSGGDVGGGNGGGGGNK